MLLDVAFVSSVKQLKPVTARISSCTSVSNLVKINKYFQNERRNLTNQKAKGFDTAFRGNNRLHHRLRRAADVCLDAVTYIGAWLRPGVTFSSLYSITRPRNLSSLKTKRSEFCSDSFSWGWLDIWSGRCLVLFLSRHWGERAGSVSI